MSGATILSIRDTVLAEITAVAAEHKKTLAPLSDALPLLDSGLDSLCLAVIVARLEESLGTDPFAASDEVAYPVTIGDFVHLYEASAGR